MKAGELALLLAALESLLNYLPMFIGAKDQDLTATERAELRAKTRSLRDRAIALSDSFSTET